MPHKNVMQSRSLHHQANAILDRLLHHCHLVKIIGKSYRTKDLTKKLNDQSEDGVDIGQTGNFYIGRIGKFNIDINISVIF